MSSINYPTILDKTKIRKYFENNKYSVSDDVLIYIRTRLTSNQSPLIQHYKKHYNKQTGYGNGDGMLLSPSFFGNSESGAYIDNTGGTSPSIDQITSNTFPLPESIGGSSIKLITQNETKLLLKDANLKYHSSHIKQITKLFNSILHKLLMLTIKESNKNKIITKTAVDKAIKKL